MAILHWQALCGDVERYLGAERGEIDRESSQLREYLRRIRRNPRAAGTRSIHNPTTIMAAFLLALDDRRVIADEILHQEEIFGDPEAWRDLEANVRAIRSTRRRRGLVWTLDEEAAA